MRLLRFMSGACAGKTITTIEVALRNIMTMIVLPLQHVTAVPVAVTAARLERPIISVGHGWNHKLVT